MGPHSLKLLARMGYGARGLVYLIIGGLATLAALGAGGKATGSRGALVELLHQPFGKALIALLAAGLLCYAGWRAVQALLDADDHGVDLKGVVVRVGLLVSAVTHTGLAFYAASLLFDFGSSGGASGDRVAWLMQQPFGRYLVAGVGLAIWGAGLAQIWKGASRRFHKRLVFSRDDRPLVSWLCAFGLVARGLVFCIIGTLFCFAALQVDPQQAGGLAQALSWLRQQPFGSWLFAIVALGLFAFGLYSLIEAAWRRIELSEEAESASQAKAARS